MWKEWDVVTFSLGRCFDRRNASSICSKVYRQENRGEDDRLLTRPLKPARGAEDLGQRRKKPNGNLPNTLKARMI